PVSGKFPPGVGLAAAAGVAVIKMGVAVIGIGVAVSGAGGVSVGPGVGVSVSTATTTNVGVACTGRVGVFGIIIRVGVVVTAAICAGPPNKPPKPGSTKIAPSASSPINNTTASKPISTKKPRLEPPPPADGATSAMSPPAKVASSRYQVSG